MIFSADGESILFSGKKKIGKKKNQWNIYRFRLADGKLTQLTDGAGDNFAPHERNPLLSVSPQGLTLTQWGEIKATK